MSRQFWTEQLSWATADGTAIATTATETIIFPNVTIPANYMQDGRTLVINASGRWSNVITAAPTLTFALRWGGVSGTVLTQSPALWTPTTATANAQWFLKILVQTRSNGATGTVFSQGIVTMTEDVGVGASFGVAAVSQTFLMGSAGLATPAAVTVDLTADTALSLTAKWSASDASNSLTGHIYTIQSLN